MCAYPKHVERRDAVDSFERAINRFYGKPLRFLGARLKVRLVKLHHVGAGREEIAHLGVHRFGQRHGHGFLVTVEVVLGLLRHGERPRQRRLDRAVGVAAQELDVAHLHGPFAPDRTDHPRHRVGMARAVERGARIVEVHPVERRREAVRVALASHLAVGDDVNSGALHVTNRDDCRIVLRLLEQVRSNSPDLLRPYPRGEATAQHLAVHEPVGLRIAADNRGR